jgi:ATP-binding cassette subfamily B protein
MLYLLGKLRPYRKLILLSILCVSLEAVCDLMQPTIASWIIDRGILPQDMAYIVRVFPMMLCVVALGASFALSRNYLSAVTSQAFAADLRRDLFARVHAMPFAKADAFEGGAFITRLTNDINQIQGFISGFMRIFFKAPVLCAGAIVMASILEIRVLPFMAGAVLFSFAVVTISMALGYPMFGKVQAAIDRLNTVVREFLGGIRLVKAFSRGDAEEARFGQANFALRRATARVSRMLSVFAPSMILGIHTATVLILFYSAGWISRGIMEVGVTVALVNYMAQLIHSLVMISNILNVFVRTRASTRRIMEIVNAAEAIPLLGGVARSAGGVGNANDTTPPFGHPSKGGELRGDLTISSLTFSYPTQKSGDPALQDIAFTLPRGASLGVVGPTGSGKSTLAALLMGFYDLTEGDITINGTSLRDIEGAYLRESASLVAQHSLLFTGTIADNIRWGRPNASPDEVETAAKAADAHGFINDIPEDYGAWIGQGGVNLSGGQRQRICIARSLIRKPSLLILDDCTSALDAVTEARVLSALRSAVPGMSSIVITQKVTTAARCDRILVLDNGKQAGYGTHAELLERCEMYRDIYASQVGGVLYAAK